MGKLKTPWIFANVFWFFWFFWIRNPPKGNYRRSVHIGFPCGQGARLSVYCTRNEFWPINTCHRSAPTHTAVVLSDSTLKDVWLHNSWWARPIVTCENCLEINFRGSKLHRIKIRRCRIGTVWLGHCAFFAPCIAAPPSLKYPHLLTSIQCLTSQPLNKGLLPSLFGVAKDHAMGPTKDLTCGSWKMCH